MYKIEYYSVVQLWIMNILVKKQKNIHSSLEVDAAFDYLTVCGQLGDSIKTRETRGGEARR